MFEIKQLVKSFKYAISGFSHALKEEQNLQIHILSSVFIIYLGLFFQIRKWEWVTVLLLIMLVIILELINTVFERLSDMLKPRLHMYVRVIKDIMAATVLISSIGATIIGLIIFYPYLSELFK